MVQHADIDHTGLTGAGGSVATDAIWDAAGDLAVGSGSNAAARLAIGATNGMALQRVGGAVAWAFPPGHEFDYVQFTSPVSPTATTEATANTVVTGNAVTYDGSTIVLIEFFSPFGAPASGQGNLLNIYLYDGSGSIGRMIALGQESGLDRQFAPLYGAQRLTPSAAAHTYSIRAAVNTGTGTVAGGAGGSGNSLPGFIRITKVA